MTDNQLAERYWPEAMKMALQSARHCGAFRFPAFDLEQAAVNGLMDALKARHDHPDHPSGDNLSALLYTCIHHRITEQFTQFARRPRTFSLDALMAPRDDSCSVLGGREKEIDELAAPPPPTGPDPAEVVELLLKCLRPRDRAAVIILRDFDSNQSAAARFLGVSSQCFNQRLVAIRNRIFPKKMEAS